MLCFVLQLIPDDYEYSTVNGDAFVSLDATTQVCNGVINILQAGALHCQSINLFKL
jgi:hypothetical protein